MASETILANPHLPLEDTTPAEDGMANVGVALGLVILAGGATSIGAAVVYIPWLVNIANSKTLAISLGLSAGVMIFVSFIEIFGKSQESFEEAGYGPEQAYALAMVTFFAGVALMLISHYVLEHLMRDEGHHADTEENPKNTEVSNSDDDIEAPSPKEKRSSSSSKKKKKNKNSNNSSTTTIAPSPKEKASSSSSSSSKKKKNNSSARTLDTFSASEPIEPSNHDQEKTDPLDFDFEDSDWGSMMLPCCDHTEDPRKKVKSYQKMAKEMQEYEEKKTDRQLCLAAGVPQSEVDGHENFKGIKEKENKRQQNDNSIVLMSYKTAFAIALHNFPEGLATFVAALGDPKMGLVLAIGIAIHNIPEGLAVSLPLYYATGNRTKAFLCGALSGSTEIFAALLGWAVLANAFSAALYAVVFGMVSGMMVLISIRELLPTAHRYDPHDTYVTLSFTGGMVVMALSLALIALF